MTQSSERNVSPLSLSLSLIGFVLISLMDRVRTNATLFAEHSARIKRSYAALDTRVVSRFTVTRDRLSSYFSSFLSIFSFLPSRSCSLHLPFALCSDPFSRTLGGWRYANGTLEIPFFFEKLLILLRKEREIQWLEFLDWIFFWFNRKKNIVINSFSIFKKLIVFLL